MISRPVSPLVFIPRFAIACILLVLIFRVSTLAWADIAYQSATPAGLKQAESLSPKNPGYHYANALLAQQREPESPVAAREFEKAATLNPRYTDALLAWSVEKEMRGDRTGAERLLLQAEHTSHLLRPAWALANFYYRQGMMPQFLAQSHEALRIIGVTGISEGRFDPNPIFRLLVTSSASRPDILRSGIPDDHTILAFYLGYLSSTGDLPNAEQVASKLMPLARLGSADPLFLFPFVNRLIEQNRFDSAVKIWAGLYDRKMVPYPGPDPAHGVFLTNGRLGGPPLNFGFDWRPAFPETVQFTDDPGTTSYRFEFAENAPETFALLVQVLPLTPSRSYTFIAKSASDFDPERCGLRWTLTDHRTGQAIPLHGDVTKGESGEARTTTEEWTVPAGTASGDLKLAYNRQPGTLRLHGAYRLLAAELKLSTNE